MPGALGKVERDRGGELWGPVEEGVYEVKKPEFQNGTKGKHWQV